MRVSILGMLVNVTSCEEVVRRVSSWMERGNRQGTYICVSNVHMVMETFDNEAFRSIVNEANLALPDSKILAWAQKSLGEKGAQQVYGPDIMVALCKRAAQDRLRIGLYGGTAESLDKIQRNLHQKFPQLHFSYIFSPPFRPLTPAEDSTVVEEIRASGTQILFVGLGCPKQELWMAEHKDRVNAVMLGVGAAFDFIAGNKRNPPAWIRSIGLGWLFRLLSEPRRLWKRYMKQNPRFVWHFSRQLFRQKFGKAA